MSRALTALILLAAASAAHAAVAPDAISGFWRIASGDAVIEIAAQNDRYRGRLVWLRKPRYPIGDPRGIGGQPVTDRHNPDPGKRDRPLIGLPLITGLTYHLDDNGQAQWRGAQVYNTENGKHYDCYAWLADPAHLKLRGYIGVTLLGRTTTWRRVPDPRVQEAS